MQREYYGEPADVSDSIAERHRSIAQDIVSEEEYGILIGGEWIESETGDTMESVDSTTGEKLASFQKSSSEDVDKAVEAAWEAYEEDWGSVAPRERSRMMHEIADRLEERKTEIARIDSLEIGKPNLHSLFADVEILVDQFRHFAGLARSFDEGRSPRTNPDQFTYTRKEPYGVVGQISAWNFAAMFNSWKLCPALASGNAVVYKPSSRAVISTLEIAKEIDEILPNGTLNVVTGTGSEVGNAITSHPDVKKASLTGSVSAGKKVMENAADKIMPVSLELGGKSPNIIFPDTDLESAVDGSIVSIFFNQGQQCVAGSRMFLHEDVYDEFMDMFIQETEKLGIGDPLRPDTDIGPMVDRKHLREVKEYIDTAVEEGATVVYGGELVDDPELGDAPFIEPTVLTDVDHSDTAACEEIFGPVLTVFKWSEYDEMIEKANDTDYGLAAGLWTNDLETAHETADDLEAGMVWVNNYLDLIEPAPYGGYKMSGIGRELSEEALDEYTQTKTVKMNFGKPFKL